MDDVTTAMFIMVAPFVLLVVIGKSLDVLSKEKEKRHKQLEKATEARKKFEELVSGRHDGAIALLQSGDLIYTEEPKSLDEGPDYIDAMLYKARAQKGDVPAFITNMDEERAWEMYKSKQIGPDGLRRCLQGRITAGELEKIRRMLE